MESKLVIHQATTVQKRHLMVQERLVSHGNKIRRKPNYREDSENEIMDKIPTNDATSFW